MAENSQINTCILNLFDFLTIFYLFYFLGLLYPIAESILFISNDLKPYQEKYNELLITSILALIDYSITLILSICALITIYYKYSMPLLDDRFNYTKTYITEKIILFLFLLITIEEIIAFIMGFTSGIYYLDNVYDFPIFYVILSFGWKCLWIFSIIFIQVIYMLMLVYCPSQEEFWCSN